jgi:hypothetical protein
MIDPKQTVKVTYRHYKKEDVILEAIGTLPPFLNRPNSDRLVVKKEDGTYEDVLKWTMISIEGYGD